TLWLGRYRSSPSPRMTGQVPVVRWSGRLQLDNLAISPDRRVLAAMLYEPPWPGDDGCICPTWLTLIDLQTHRVQYLPDASQPTLATDFYYTTTYLLGWLNANQLAVEHNGLWIAQRDSRQLSKSAQPALALAHRLALAPDRHTLIGMVAEGTPRTDGIWRFDLR